MSLFLYSLIALITGFISILIVRNLRSHLLLHWREGAWNLIGGKKVYLFLSAGVVVLLILLISVLGVQPALVIFPILIPSLLYVLDRIWVRKQEQGLQNSALPFFTALLSFLKAGIALPEALKRTSKSETLTLHSELFRKLIQFERGELLNLKLRQPLPSPTGQLIHHFLLLIQEAHLKGFPIIPSLERLIPLLEQQDKMEKRQNKLLQHTLGQLLFIFLLPWVLLFFMGKLEPHFLGDFYLTPYGFLPLMLALFLELIGALLLWHFSRFF